MDERMKKRAALYMLIKFVDESNGSIEVKTDAIKRIFNDADDIVKVEYTSGEVALLADADFIVMDEAIRTFQKRRI